MKLQTYIQPRLDGTVIVVGEDSQEYHFKADADGALTCDVTCEATVSRLLAGGYFEPVDADDYDKAIELSKAGTEKAEQEGEAGNEGEEEGDFTEEAIPGGLPVEANTPPVPAKKASAKKASA